MGLVGTGLSYVFSSSRRGRRSGGKPAKRNKDEGRRPRWVDIPVPSVSRLEKAAGWSATVKCEPKKEGEAPASPAQIEVIKKLAGGRTELDWPNLGREQAENLILRCEEERRKADKVLLKSHYLREGFQIPEWAVEYILDHPVQTMPWAPRRTSGTLILATICYCALVLLLKMPFLLVFVIPGILLGIKSTDSR